ncbi:cbb3-type cytochrome oxidase subunit 3 [Lysobacter sp. A286]
MLSGIITVALMLLFLAICYWAWLPEHKQAFDATARLALDDTPSDTRHDADGNNDNENENPVEPRP